MSHSDALPSFQILNISPTPDGQSYTVSWTPFFSAKNYEVDFTSDKNCAKTIVSLKVSETSVTFRPLAPSSNISYACIYAINAVGAIVKAASNNPVPLIQSAGTSTSSTPSAASSSSSGKIATTSSVARTLTSYVNLLVGDSAISGCANSTQGVGGPAISAGLYSPTEIAIDGNNNIFVTEGYRIQMIPSTSGTFFGQSMQANYIYTVFGDYADIKAGNITSGAAASGQYSSINGVATDSSGNLYILGATGSHGGVFIIPKTSGTYFGQAMTAGNIYLIAGSGAGTAGDGGPAISAKLGVANDLAVDSIGNVYISDTQNNRVQMVPAVSGTYFGQVMTANYMYTIAGSSVGTAGNAGVGGVLGTSATITGPIAIAVDGSGNVFIEDSTNQYAYMLAANTGTYFGQSMTVGYLYSIASSMYAYSINTDAAGNVYLGSATAVRMIPANSGTYFNQSMTAGNLYTILGNSQGCTVSGSNALTASTNWIKGLAIDSVGNLIVSQNITGKLSVLPAASGNFYGQAMTLGKVYNIAGISAPSNIGVTTGPVLSVELVQPYSVAYDSANNLYIGDYSNVLMVPSTSGTYFGQAMVANSVYNLTSHKALSVAIDLNGNVLFTDDATNGLYVIAASTNTFYGTAMTVGQRYQIAGAGASQASGVAISNVQFTTPIGVCVDSQGNVYVADWGYHRVIMIPVSSGTYFGQAMTAYFAYNIAGGNGLGYTGLGGIATSAQLRNPGGGTMAVDGSGNLYFADSNRVLMLPAVTGTYFSQSMTANNLYLIAGLASGTSTTNSTALNGQLATTVGLNFAYSTNPVALDHLGNVYFGETGTQWIHMVPQVSGTYFGTPMTVANNYVINNPYPIHGYSPTGTVATSSYFSKPYGLVIDSQGNVVIADEYNSSIRVLTVPQ